MFWSPLPRKQYVLTSGGLLVPGAMSFGGRRLLISPRTGTMRSLKAGSRWDVYAFVVRRTCLAAIMPRDVCTIQGPSDVFWRCVAAVLVWRLNDAFDEAFRDSKFSRIQVTSL